MPDHRSSPAEETVINIRTRRGYRPAGGGLESSAPTGDLEHYAHGEEPDDFRHRMAVNAIAFLFVAVLVIAGVWLADTLVAMRKTQDCILSGKRACAPVDAPRPVR
ncbi:MAG: hypothetical protein AB7V13_15760 [Pseudorhodoplanes sp.]|uniref:hypothetical protein n=1 Tax=Pseudorhodoplanes sp. TaxID=1934341 RepID=UPI003D0B572C